MIETADHRLKAVGSMMEPPSLRSLVEGADFAANPRGLWLFHAACASRIADLLPDDGARMLIRLTEQVADGAITLRTWGEAVYLVVDPYLGNEKAADGAGGMTFDLLMHLYPGEAGATLRVVSSVIQSRAVLALRAPCPDGLSGKECWERATNAEEAELRRLFQCVAAGAPPSVVPGPHWRTDVVRALSEAIHQERAYDRLPILADALQDAGCESSEVLDHCRGPGPHAYGCWVVEALLASKAIGA